MRNQLFYQHSSQCGATLIVSLVLLLIATILGISGMGNASLEERISASHHEYRLAFESAEHALIVGEGFLKEKPFSFLEYTPECTNGLCFRGVWEYLDPDSLCTLNGFGDGVWMVKGAKGIWSGKDYRVVESKLPGVSKAPKYVIEFLCHTPASPYAPIHSYISSGDRKPFYGLLFRITALGYGGEKSRVMLQSTYAKPMNNVQSTIRGEQLETPEQWAMGRQSWCQIFNWIEP